ncbi:MAG: DUF2935 domain-containing protein [Bacilli bacterium]|nr:DUF2935 domain-containing protein [Bacilli bacterium]
MLNNEELLKTSLVTGLSYLMILRGFCLNINFSLLDNNQTYKDSALDFYQKFTDLIKELLNHADKTLSEDFLNSEIIINRYTIQLVELTEKLFSTNIALEIAGEVANLSPGTAEDVSDETIEQINMINKVTLVISLNFLDFLKDIFEKEINNQLFSYSYPFLIRKMMEDVNLYILILERLIRKIPLDPTFALDYEYQSMNLLKAFAMFLRSYIDPSRSDVLIKTQSFVIEIEHLLEDYKKLGLTPENQVILTEKGKNIDERFGEFLAHIIEELLNSEIYLTIEPVFLDNMYRVVNLSRFFIFDPKHNIQTKEIIQ